MVELSVIALQFSRQDPARFARLAAIGLSRTCTGLDGRVCQFNYAAKLSARPRKLRAILGFPQWQKKPGIGLPSLSESSTNGQNQTNGG